MSFVKIELEASLTGSRALNDIDFLIVNGGHRETDLPIGESLLDSSGEGESGVQLAAMDDGVLRVARGEQHLDVRIDQARLAMSGNLCKCGNYDPYLRAVMRASQEA